MHVYFFKVWKTDKEKTGYNLVVFCLDLVLLCIDISVFIMLKFNQISGTLKSIAL